MKKGLNLLLLLVLVLLVPCMAYAAEQEEPTIYVIKKGDTLWGLSERFIKDPRYWPNMWSKNSRITNPHLLYPGQKVRVFPDRLELVTSDQQAVASPGSAPSTQNSVAAKASEITQDVVAERTFSVLGNEGFLLESDVKPAGTIVGISNDRIIAGDDDIVYTDIGTQQGVRGGEKYSIFRKAGSISHPATNEIMGTKIIPLGRLQLTDLQTGASRAIITKNFKEISAGSYLLPYNGERRREIELKMSKRDLNGYILDSYSGTSIMAAGDIVYIDLGSSQGAEPGNMLYIVRDVKLDRRYTEGRVDQLPQELLGALVILETGKKTSTAIIVKSIDAIYKGERLITQTK